MLVYIIPKHNTVIWTVFSQKMYLKRLLVYIIPKHNTVSLSNGLISKNSILISNIFNNVVTIIIFILIGIYQWYLNMRLVKYDNIHFTFFCIFFKKVFIFSKFSILMVDKNRKYFNSHFMYEDFKKILRNDSSK